jgi:hypothetical protein
VNTTILVLAVGAVFFSSVVLRLVLGSRVRQVHAQSRFRLFAVLLWIGVGSQLVGVVTAAVIGQMGAGIGFLITRLLLGAACLLEMRKLRREF